MVITVLLTTEHVLTEEISYASSVCQILNRLEFSYFSTSTDFLNIIGPSPRDV